MKYVVEPGEHRGPAEGHRGQTVGHRGQTVRHSGSDADPIVGPDCSGLTWC